jgi:mannose-6-phosphate isomerase-like protein (cupin superfamily)
MTQMSRVGQKMGQYAARQSVGYVREERKLMRIFDRDQQEVKGWLVGPWNSSIPVAVGYANAGVDEQHYHVEMNEVYLVVQGRSTAVVDGQTVRLEAGSVLVVEPGEVHTFTESTPDYYHFVVHAPVVKGDKHYPQ